MNTKQKKENLLLNQLLDYIAEIAKESGSQNRDIFKLNEFILYPKNFSGLPGILFNLNSDDDSVWLKVERKKEQAAPEISSKNKELLTMSSDPQGQEPAINYDAISEKIEIDASSRQYWESTAAKILEDYRPKWLEWAENEKINRKTIKLYEDLYELKNRLEEDQTLDPCEFICGMGMSYWNFDLKEKNCVFKYPIFTQALEISIEEKTHAIEIRPRAVKPSLELDFFVEKNIPYALELEKEIKEKYLKEDSLSFSPFNSSDYKEILKQVSAMLDSRGEFVEKIQPDNFEKFCTFLPKDKLVVSDEWVLFARKKIQRPLLEDIQKFQEKINQGCEIPDGPRAFITEPSDQTIEYVSSSFKGIYDYSLNKESKELYFPLPYNKEQKTIIEKLEKSCGVVVQGPPGTGKSHTIANIICHYLASGQKILVTSKGDDALKVLQDKIPEQIRALTIARLTNDKISEKQSASSIEKIQGYLSQLNPESTKEEIARIEQDISETHQLIIKNQNNINKIAQAHFSDIDFDGEKKRAFELADFIANGKDNHSWFEDEPNESPSVTEEEMQKLRNCKQKVGKDLSYLNISLPSNLNFPSVNDFISLHEGLKNLKEIGNELNDKYTFFIDPEKFKSDKIKDLFKNIDNIKDLLKKIEKKDNLSKLHFQLDNPNYFYEKTVFEELLIDIKKLKEEDRKFIKFSIDMPDKELEELEKLENYLKKRESYTAKFQRLFSTKEKNLETQVKQIRINSSTPKNSEDWQIVCSYIKHLSEEKKLISRWNKLSQKIYLPKIQTILSSEDLVQDSFDVNNLVDYEKEIKNLFNLEEKITLELLEFLQKQRQKKELYQYIAQFDHLKNIFVEVESNISRNFKKFLNILGKKELSQEDIKREYEEFFSELKHLHGLSKDLSYIAEIANKIELSGAPKFAEKIRTQEDLSIASSWKDAWKWAQLQKKLNSIDKRKELISLYEEKQELEKKISKLYVSLIEQSAWLKIKNNASQKTMNALTAYANNVRRMGKGTGKSAEGYRREAKKHMEEAYKMVPCWIMNQSRVSEFMPSDMGSFDLVIVDEASQSNIEVFPSVLRGKKILIVGDDKQVSPSNSFNCTETIQTNEKRFLSELCYSKEMTEEKSFYDLGLCVFANQQIMLKEHFRCAPSIIEYSNQVFYNGDIQALRVPKISERLDPPLIDVYCPNGVRKENKTNLEEAEFIAEEINTLINDPRFDNRTLGVISLLGKEQAKLISDIVRKKCGDSLDHRKFKCGEATTFQGSERDIIFLSLVADIDNHHALSIDSNQYKQRFNVAASRARDRMYLVRSVKIENLSSTDIRLDLLKHFQNPIKTDNAKIQNEIDKCESKFEKDVYSQLVEKGYNVTSQVKSGSYRIDLVVEDENGRRLAIECDGDFCHGPERWQEDFNRQRVLERAGWTFWRCFASTWIMNKEKTLDGLVKTLSKLNINPSTSNNKKPCLVECREYYSKEQKNI